MSGYGVDRWFVPIVIDSTNNTFRVEETIAGTVDVTVAAGTYWLNSDQSGGSTYPGLLLAVAAALNSSGTLTNSYVFSSTDPVQGSLPGQNAGLELRAIGAADSFKVHYSHANFTMDPQWFGHRSSYGQLSINLFVASTTDGAEEYVHGDYTLLGQWISHTLSPYDAATSKLDRPTRNIVYSHNRPSDRYAVEWNNDTIRRIVYEYVPAVHVYTGRGDVTAYATVGDMAQRDTANAFDVVWSALSRNETVLIVHDEGDEDHALNTHLVGNFEAVKLARQQQAQDMQTVVTLQRSGGEMFKIDVELWVDPTSSYDY